MITDELRGFMDGADGYELWCPRHKKDLLAIADRIDEEYEKAIRELNNLADASVLLPVDADGVPIRVGDMLRFKSETCDKVFTATSVEWNGSRWMLMASDGGSVGYGGFDYLHHVPTPEDVLREFAERVCNSGHQWGLDADAIIAEYAKRLQLKD